MDALVRGLAQGTGPRAGDHHGVGCRVGAPSAGSLEVSRGARAAGIDAHRRGNPRVQRSAGVVSSRRPAHETLARGSG